MALKDRKAPLEDTRGIGIHGTKTELEDTIGQPVSGGCVRMANRDVEELFSIVPEGTFGVIEE